MFSYDQVPYHSSPFVQSHPDRLAVIATLFGLAPQAIDQCRILELGCASGGNLLPMAEMFPDSSFLGIDLSERQLVEGRAVVEQLGLNNIELLHCDIRDFGREFGAFHYIIAHGVYSWVPPEVQQKMLDICREQLTPNGLAYISYNTYPGWRLRGMIRDMLVYHTQQFDEPQTRIEQARALLAFLAESVSQNSAYGAFLKEELDLFGQVSDAYLYHDHLEDTNEPVYFHDFVQQAEACGLQFLGEAEFSVMASFNFAPEIDQTLQRISRDLIQMEQYMDFLRNRSFRQTVLCHREQRLERAINPLQLQGLYLASSLRVDAETVDLTTSDSLVFSKDSLNIETQHPLVKAALLILQEHWPNWMSFQNLVQQVRERIPGVTGAMPSTEINHRLGEHLMRCYAANALELHSVPAPFTIAISAAPQTSALARLQAKSTARVTNHKHEYVQLDKLGQQVLSLLDGRRNSEAIVDHLQELVAQGHLTVSEDNNKIEDPERIRLILAEALPRTLQQFAQLALLMK